MTDSIDEVIAPVIAALGLDLEAVELTGKKNRQLLVAVDTDGGVGIDEITDATREISAALDATDVMGNAPYTLEVTSRGTDRPLTEPRHWRRNSGRLVAVDLTEGERFEARIGSSDDHGVELTTSNGIATYPYGEIARAVVQIELNRKDF